MTGRVAGKVVVVTGAARGQGAAEAAALAAEGAIVLATDILDDEGAAMAAALGVAVEYRRLDVTQLDEWEGLARHLAVTHGRVDAIVNNAGVPARDRLPDIDLDSWELTFRINVTGPMFSMKTLVPLMSAGGSIVNICSVAAMSGHVAAAYTASKWALRGLSRAASLELGMKGIRVNAVMPGLVDTPMMANASPAFAHAAVGEVPLGRMGVPGDVAPLIVYLVSDESAYVNGAEITVDGGLTAHVSHKHIAEAIAPASTTPEATE